MVCQLKSECGTLRMVRIGGSLGSPSGAPASTQALIFSTSASDSRRSFAKWPYFGSANHGGIFLVATALLMALARGVLSYVRNEDGPISPGRWQLSEFFSRIGNTSLLNAAQKQTGQYEAHRGSLQRSRRTEYHRLRIIQAKDCAP